MDQDLLPFSQIGFLDQRLPGGQAHQGDGSRFLHGEVLRFQRHVGFVYGNELCERADPAIARPSIDLVTRLELPDLGPDPNHGSGHVVPQDEGRAIRQDEFELSIPDLRIQKIEPGRVDLDQDIVIPQCRLRHLAKPQSALLLVSIDDEGFHDGPFSSLLPTPAPG